MVPMPPFVRTLIMPLRLLYAAVMLCFLAVHGIAFQKLNALASASPSASTAASGD